MIADQPEASRCRRAKGHHGIFAALQWLLIGTAIAREAAKPLPRACPELPAFNVREADLPVEAAVLPIGHHGQTVRFLLGNDVADGSVLRLS